MHSSTNESQKPKPPIKWICLALVIILFLLYLTYYQSPLDGYVKEMKEDISSLKALFEVEQELFEEAQQILAVMEAEKLRIITKHNEFGIRTLFVSVLDPRDKHWKEKYALFDASIFSIEEKLVLAEVISLLYANADFSSVEYGEYLIRWRNRTDLRLAKCTDNEIIAQWENETLYMEEISENWYAFIITPEFGY